MNKYKNWFTRFKNSNSYDYLKERPVAYFCMEYALPDNLPIYSGGLGVLAGDYVIESYLQNFPLIAIGLFYSKKLIPSGHDIDVQINDPKNLGLKTVKNKMGKPIIVEIPIAERKIFAKAWYYKNQTADVYLLDTNLTENDPEDRSITDILYATDYEKRIEQEIILGIGGTILLKKLGIDPSIYHMNEGHSAFLVYQLAFDEMKKYGIGFEPAFKKAKQHIAFTNHTLFVGGHDQFDAHLVALLLSGFAKKIKVPVTKLVEKGIEGKDGKNFSTTALAFESSCVTNAVSRLHQKEAAKIWPNRDMEYVTNGVNLQRWDMTSGNELKKAHNRNKIELISYIRKNKNIEWSEKHLIACWSRRMVSYKRPLAFFDDFKKAEKLLMDKKRPIHLIFSGYPHYMDNEGGWLQKRIKQLSHNEFKDKIVYLSGYGTNLSTLLTSGSDIWLNTPIVGLEACGTSGMKAALNGTINCSTDDGWLPETNLDLNGYKLDSELIGVNLHQTFEKKILPDYYQNPDRWYQKMLSSRETIIENFGSDRMLKNYIEQIYMPILDKRH